MRHFEGYLIAIFVITGVMHISSAVEINGRRLSIDSAIMEAAVAAGGDLDEMLPDNHTVLVELDILYDIETYIRISTDLSSVGRKKRKAVLPLTMRWDDARVPYEITNDFSAADRQAIQAAIEHYNQYTCIRFVPATASDYNRVRFQNGAGCSSYVGMQNWGVQNINLAPGCRYKDIIIHEMGHAIGFHHEQTRPDRDDYVTIVSENIQNGRAFNFRKYSTSQVNTHSVPYDYTSVMHYSQYAFSANGKPTIIAKDPSFQKEMGNQEGFSFKDIWLANEIYQCAARTCQPVACPQGSFQGQDCKCWCDSGILSNPVKECGTTHPVCEDKHDYCPIWASSGFCQDEGHKDFMLNNCKLSCNVCAAA